MKRSRSTGDLTNRADGISNVDFSFRDAIEHMKALNTNDEGILSTVGYAWLEQRGKYLYRSRPFFHDLGDIISNPVLSSISKRYTQDHDFVDVTVFIRVLSVAMNFADKYKVDDPYTLLALIETAMLKPELRREILRLDCENCCQRFRQINNMQRLTSTN